MAKIGREPALLTAEEPAGFSVQTVKYGALGTFQEKKVYLLDVEPGSRICASIKGSDYFTVSYFPPKWDRIYAAFDPGVGGGAEELEKTGLSPECREHGITYRQADEIYICKKLYMKHLIMEDIPEDVFAHYIVIGEIIDHIVR